MISKLRIWRVVPTNKVGVQAPSFFVESTKDDLKKAEEEAEKLARIRTRLSSFKDWSFQLEKVRARKDEYGRYFKYHQ